MGFLDDNSIFPNHTELEHKTSSFDNDYKIECKLGEGSFAEVLKCEDLQSGTVVAAKQLKNQFWSATHVSDIPELMAMRKLTKHPNVLHMMQAHYEPQCGKVILIFELMDMSLYDLMRNRRRPLPELKAKNYLYQIVKGVNHIHMHGIFHRDIKPENILLKGDLLKISDLGSIKSLNVQQPYTEYISTRWYRPPECLLTTGFYGPKMDIWAIGCVFYELLTLKPLFPGANELDQITKINLVLGTPSSRLLSKFNKKSRNHFLCFPPKVGTGLDPLIPLITEAGRDIIKQMIVYDPEQRSNIRRLMDHKYFSDFRKEELFQRHLNQAQEKTSTSKIPPKQSSMFNNLEKRKLYKIPEIKTKKTLSRANNKLSMVKDERAKIRKTERCTTRDAKPQAPTIKKYSTSLQNLGKIRTQVTLDQVKALKAKKERSNRDLFKEKYIPKSSNLIPLAKFCSTGSFLPLASLHKEKLSYKELKSKPFGSRLSFLNEISKKSEPLFNRPIKRNLNTNRTNIWK